MPDSIAIKKVDYNDHASLVGALRGQDALVITLAGMAPHDTQKKLIAAAAEAGVSWILPNDWSPDMANEALAKDLMVGDSKRKVHEYVERLSKSSWIAVSTGFWYEYSLAITAAYGFDFVNRSVTIYDDGETRINTSTWPQVGRAVAALLSLPVTAAKGSDKERCLDNFRNKYIYVSSFTVSQQDMLYSALRVTQTSLEDWAVRHEDAEQRYKTGVEELKSGDKMGFAKLGYSRIFFENGGGNVEDTKGLQNDMLGLPKEDLDEYTSIAMSRSIQRGGMF